MKDSSNSLKKSVDKYKSETVIEEKVDEEMDNSLIKSRQESQPNLDNNAYSDNDSVINNKENIETNLNNKETINYKDLNKRELLDTIKPMNTTGTKFEKYILEKSIPHTFNKIFTELIIKKIDPKDYFAYTSARLNEIDKDFEQIKEDYKNAY